MEHSPEAIAKWAYALRYRFGGRLPSVLELAKGPLVYALQRYEFLVLFPVNPATLAKYREAFVPSGAKDDPTDAEVALDILLRHPEKLQPLKPQSAAMRTLATLVEQRRRLVGDETRITNRLVSTLKQYYPQALDWFEDRDTVMFCDFLDVGQRSSTPSGHGDQRWNRSSTNTMPAAHTSLRSASRASGLRLPSRTMRPLSAHARCWCRHWWRSCAPSCRRSIASMPRSTPSPRACLTMRCSRPCPVPAHPGPAVTGCLRRASGALCKCRADQRYSGIAPVLERSGNKCWVHWRLACPTFLRQTFVEWAGSTIPSSFWAGAYYQQQRAKGCSHQVAVRALAFKWITDPVSLLEDTDSL